MFGILMDRNEMTTQVVLARERAAAPGMMAYVGLGAVGVMGRHVGLEVELPSEGARALSTWVLATGVVLLRRLVARTGVLVGVLSRDVRVGLGTSLEVLGRDVTVDETRVGATPVVGRGLGLEVVAIGADVFEPGGNVKERVGRRVSVGRRIIRDLAGGGTRLALRRWHMESAECVEVDIELGVGKETVLRDSSTVGRERLVVERLETVVGELVVIAQRVTRCGDCRSWTTVRGAVGQESVDVSEAVVWEYKRREEAVVDAEIVEFTFECVWVRSEKSVDTCTAVGTREEPVEVRGLGVDRRVGWDCCKGG